MSSEPIEHNSVFDAIRKYAQQAPETIALREAQSRGLVMADRVALPCCLCFINAAAAGETVVISAARQALAKAWT